VAVSHQVLTVEPGFSPRVIYVEFVVDKVALMQMFLRAIRFFFANYSISASYSDIRIWYSGPISGRGHERLSPSPLVDLKKEGLILTIQLHLNLQSELCFSDYFMHFSSLRFVPHASLIPSSTT
jgi:hypothetical protein